MFGHTRTTKLENDIRKLEDEKRRVKDELADLKQTKKMEDENIRHLVRIKGERLEIQHEKKTQEAIAKVKDEYRDKQEALLNKQLESGEKRYAEILARLPNVTVGLKGKV